MVGVLVHNFTISSQTLTKCALNVPSPFPGQRTSGTYHLAAQSFREANLAEE
jgi:hypothetical protein